jgi:hypothetical protein
VFRHNEHFVYSVLRPLIETTKEGSQKKAKALEGEGARKSANFHRSENPRMFYPVWGHFTQGKSKTES